MYRTVTVVTLLYIRLTSVTSADEVKLAPDISFNMPKNFDDRKLPCSKQTVIFPNSISNSIKLESDISVNGIVLPNNGELDLVEAAIILGEDLSEHNCTGREDVHYMDRSTLKWNQADVWSSPKYNKATPDAERMPCSDDVVVIPPEAQFTLVLPDLDQTVQQLVIKNNSFNTRTFLSNFILHQDPDRSQTFISNKFLGSGVVVDSNQQCFSRAGCPCQKYPLQTDCLTKYCLSPKCVYPIQPIGNCCKICGGSISFDIDESFDMIAFKGLVEEMVNSYGKDKLVYHIGRIQDKVQLVVTDLYEYDETSVGVVTEINHRMHSDWAQGAKALQLSGSPLSKTGQGGIMFVSIFFAVILVFGAIYLYYYKLPNVWYPVVGQSRTRGMLSRFQRRTDSVVSLTRRDSGATEGFGTSTAFRNPLYNSKRDRVQVTESILEE